MANALYFPSYISAEWALQYYNLLTDRVHTITSVTPRKSTYLKTSLGNFEFQHLHKHRYSFGYEIQPELGFMIARPEKALLDYLKLRKHNMKWNSSQEMEEFLSEDLRINLSSLLEQTTAENLRELIPQLLNSFEILRNSTHGQRSFCFQPFHDSYVFNRLSL